MRRGERTDEQWEKLSPLLPPQKPEVGRPAQDHRVILNGIVDRANRSPMEGPARAIWAMEHRRQPLL